MLHSTDMAKHPAAVALGRRKTAKKSAASRLNLERAHAALNRLTPEERSAIGRKAVQARWAKHR